MIGDALSGRVCGRFSNQPIGLVGAHSLMLGVLLSAAEWDGWITWGHEASILMIVPIVAWAALQRV